MKKLSDLPNMSIANVFLVSDRNKELLVRMIKDNKVYRVGENKCPISEVEANPDRYIIDSVIRNGPAKIKSFMS